MLRRWAPALNLKMASLSEPVSSLSGGNAQKVVIGKWLMRKPGLLLLDDPTKGVDVGTKAEFYALLTKLCDEGKTILFYSSDDEELIGLCDRVLVLHDGRHPDRIGRRDTDQGKPDRRQPGCFRGRCAIETLLLEVAHDALPGALCLDPAGGRVVRQLHPSAQPVCAATR